MQMLRFTICRYLIIYGDELFYILDQLFLDYYGGEVFYNFLFLQFFIFNFIFTIFILYVFCNFYFM